MQSEQGPWLVKRIPNWLYAESFCQTLEHLSICFEGCTRLGTHLRCTIDLGAKWMVRQPPMGFHSNKSVLAWLEVQIHARYVV